MPWATSPASLISIYALGLGAGVASAIFFYLWRVHKHRSLGLWMLAFVAKATGAIAAAQFLSGRELGWKFGFAFFDFAFVALLVEAWRVQVRGVAQPAFTALYAASALAVASSLIPLSLQAYWPLHCLLFGMVFLSACWITRSLVDAGSRPYRFLLLCLATFNLCYSAALWLARESVIPGGFDLYLSCAPACDAALCSALALSAVLLWVQAQHRINTDPLTGLLNRSALSQRVSSLGAAVVAVCDIDHFKQINDRFGHLTGDEVLQNVAHLIMASIRREDEAFRWGGDEIVVLFHNEDLEVVRDRMRGIEERLLKFRLRKQELLPVVLSWGAAETRGRTVLQTLEAADREMYAYKRNRAGRPPQPV